VIGRDVLLPFDLLIVWLDVGNVMVNKARDEC